MESWKTTPHDVREKIKCALTGNPKCRGIALTPEKELLRRRHMREAILRRYQAGWMPRAGRCKKITYFSHIAGEVKLDGSWELLIANWLDQQNINWVRNTIRFKYINLKGVEASYTPDFYLINEDCYLEIKGYETELDHCKWSQFKSKLRVLKRNDIVAIQQQIKEWKRTQAVYEV